MSEEYVPEKEFKYEAVMQSIMVAACVAIDGIILILFAAKALFSR